MSASFKKLEVARVENKTRQNKLDGFGMPQGDN